MVATYDLSNDPRRVLYVLLAGAEGSGPAARAAQQAQDNELADFLRGAQEEVVESAEEALAQRKVERAKVTPPQKAREDMQREEFAERAARRLESVAARLEKESKTRGVDGNTLARAQELRVAAFMVRDEAEVVARKAALGLLRREAAVASGRGAKQDRTAS